MVAAIIPDVVHNMMMELRWQTVADRILVWLEEREVVKHGDAAEQGGARRRVDSIK